MTFFDRAALLARRGWVVHPVHSVLDGGCTCGKGDHGKDAGKHPVLSGWQEAATTDLGQLGRWDAKFPFANVGIVTGPRSGLLVLDVDGEAGEASLNSLIAANGPLPPTVEVRTGSGGRQLYFRWTLECEGLTVLAGFLPGLDYRGSGGQVVAPPSRHRSGRCYEWLVGPDATVADPPGWLLAAMRAGHAGKPATPATVTTAEPSGVIVMEAGDDLLGEGVPEGKRHCELLRRVGRHLARGDSPQTVLDLALRWAERCDPPFPAEEAEKHTQKLVEKETAKREARQSMFDVPMPCEPLPFALVVSADDPPPSPPPPPLDQDRLMLGGDALHGLAGEIVNTLAPHTEADPVALLVTTLVAFGNAVGRQPYFQVEGDKHHPNLFAVLVGQSAKGRKGTSKGRVLSLFEQEAEWRTNCIAGGLSSGEGLIYAVRDPVTANEPVKEKGKVVGYEAVVKDHGVPDKRLMVFEPEFAKVLKTKGREGNTLSEVIREAWDSGTLKVLTRNSPMRATDAHVSLVGHVTLDELVECLKTTDAYNGLANRFLWAAVGRTRRLPDGGGDLDLAPLRAKVASAVSRARGIGRVTRTDAASALWREAYLGELAAEHPGLIGACTARSDPQVLRLSLVYALLDGLDRIDVPHLKAALAVWRYCEASAGVVFRRAEAKGSSGSSSTSHAPQTTEGLAGRLLTVIRSQPGVNRRGLYTATGNRVRAEAMDAALAHLVRTGLAVSQEGESGGRPGECWWAMGDQPGIDTPILLLPPQEAGVVLRASDVVLVPVDEPMPAAGEPAKGDHPPPSVDCEDDEPDEDEFRRQLRSA